MKKVMLLLLLVSSVFAQGQSLKEALYSGKLKNQPGTVIRKGDDLASKMDTVKADTAQKAAVSDSVKTAVLKADSTAAVATVKADSANVDTTTATAANTEIIDTAATAVAAAPPVPAPKPKDNNALWKEYMNTVVDALKTEALSSKKIKKGTYFATVSYTIETDGQVTLNDVMLSPENETLKKQIQDRITLEAPRLNPVLTSTGTPRKVTRKYNFSLTKE